MPVDTTREPLMRYVRVRIEGRVQGVGFRAWVVREATALGLDGSVANRRDGGVEAVFAGPADRVDVMVARCYNGPPAATVAMVKVLAEPGAVASGFQVLPTR
jgi:acylphosphatase